MKILDLLFIVFLFVNYEFAQGQDIYFPGEEVTSKARIREQSSRIHPWRPPVPTASNCGLKSNFQPLILNGTASREGEHPWLIALFHSGARKLEYICAGTLISNRLVITAAHCVNGTASKNIHVVLGGINIENRGANTVSRKVERIMVHPDYVFYSYGDVAVIQMDAPVTFGNLITPICLWDEQSDLAHVVGEKGIVAGWGADEAGKTYVNQARQIEIPIVDEVTCLRAAFAFTSLTSNKTFCAGGRDGRIPCRGDSGGGFVMKRGGRWRLRGVVSSALSSNSEVAICDSSQYAVFSDVAKFETWLKNILNEVQEESTTTNVKDVTNITSISEQMCKKWSEIQTGSSSKLESVDSNSITRDFPHMATLGFNKSENGEIFWMCGASLISENFILTAAHCTVSREYGDVQMVRLGDFNLKITADDAKPEDYKVKRTLLHPDYKPQSKYNDIGLLELTNTVTFNDYIKPACLQHSEQVLDKNWIVTGWSQGGYQGTEDYLQKFLIKEFKNEECNKVYNKSIYRTLRNGVSEKHICAGDDYALLCQGTSGSPLQVRNKFGSYNIIGVLKNFGKSCIVPTPPAVFTRVSSYIEWIESIVWPQKNR